MLCKPKTYVDLCFFFFFGGGGGITQVNEFFWGAKGGKKEDKQM